MTLYRNSECAVENIRMVLDNGVGPVGRVEPLAIHVLLRLDGETPLRELVTASANELGLAVADFAAAVRRPVRKLYAAGLLELAEAGLTYGHASGGPKLGRFRATT